MKIWLPYIVGGSGVDVFTKLLARGLRERGLEVVAQGIPHGFQYAPMILRALRAPQGTDIIIGNSWNAFAFRRSGARLFVIEHHCIFDEAYTPYRSNAQAIFHDTLVRRFERASFNHGDTVIAVSQYTANATAKCFPGVKPRVILNGIDTAFFCPAEKPERNDDQPFRLLFVGNWTERKGADLIAPIMRALGPGFELRYTSGLRTKDSEAVVQNMQATGHLTNQQLRQAYQEADALLFPTRLEGFGYAAAEAMACGTPVITTNCSALPELVQHNETGILCSLDDVRAFAEAARTLKNSPQRLEAQGKAARQRAITNLSLARMTDQYIEALQRTIANPSSEEAA